MEQGKFIGFCAVFAIVLGIVIAVTGPGTKFGNAWSYLTSGNTAQHNVSAPAQGSSVVGGPSLSAVKVDAILRDAGSPAAGSGQTFYQDSLTYGIDDAYALAFFHEESNYGTKGAATQTLSIGNINCTDGYNCIGRFRAYSSWSAGIDDWYKLIKDVYVGQGLSTVESIIPHYAPSSDNNDESAYITSVESDVQAWRAA